MIRVEKTSIILALWRGFLYKILLKAPLDPFVLTIGGGVSILSGVVSAPLYLFCLKDKDFNKSILIVLIFVSLELLLITPFNANIGFLGSYMVLVFTLLFIKFSKFMGPK